MSTFEFMPVGTIRTNAKHRFETPRQAVLSRTTAKLVWCEDADYSLAAADLAGFSRIWLVFVFHLNLSKPWKPKVRPPVSPDGKRYGVFATRSPHRPNPIGLSCVELLGIEQDGLLLGSCDLLDGTPVLDVKPYIPRADSFPDAKIGWSECPQTLEWSLAFTEVFLAKTSMIFQKTGLDIAGFCQVQLSVNPLDRRRKRVKRFEDGYTIGCRTWKILFTLDETNRRIDVRDVFSNYSPEDLAAGSPDPYGDKNVHREFIAKFT